MFVSLLSLLLSCSSSLSLLSSLSLFPCRLVSSPSRAQSASLYLSFFLFFPPPFWYLSFKNFAAFLFLPLFPLLSFFCPSWFSCSPPCCSQRPSISPSQPWSKLSSRSALSQVRMDVSLSAFPRAGWEGLKNMDGCTRRVLVREFLLLLPSLTYLHLSFSTLEQAPNTINIVTRENGCQYLTGEGRVCLINQFEIEGNERAHHNQRGLMIIDVRNKLKTLLH